MRRQKITLPNLGEIKATAQQLNLNINDAEAEMFRAFFEPLIADYQLIDDLNAPGSELKYSRAAIHRPAASENRLNAWYYKAQVKGAASGKLAGRTVVIKDNVSVADVPMMNGSAIWEGFTPSEDATVVGRLLDAGAEIVGKAVCENLCFSGGSHTSATGPVLNPHRAEFMAGGSSSGCAALLVAGEADLAVGGDQGGSVRMPSSFSGCYGLKPTYGLVPYTGALPIAQSVDHLGPMAMSSADCALLLEVMAGYDGGLDPRQDPRLATKQYRRALNGDAQGLRIGVVKQGFSTPSSEPDVDKMVYEAAQRFGRAGATVTDISIPEHTTAANIMLVSMLEGTLATFNEMSAVGTIATGHFQLDAIEFYERVRKQRAKDLPITVKTVLLFALAMRNRYGIYYSAKAQNLIRGVRAAYDRALQSCDLLIMPTTPMKALRIPPPEASQETIMANALPMIGNTAPFDATGHPSMSIPVGMSDGLPVGMMINGRCGADDVVLRAAHAFEMLAK